MNQTPNQGQLFDSLRASNISAFPPLGGGIEGGREATRAARTRTPSNSPFVRGRVLLDALTPHRVCLIKPSSLGDVVHALPVLSSLKQRWPEARFSWVINSGLRSLVEGHPDLDEAIPFDRARMHAGPAGLRRFASFVGELRKRRFDLAIDLQGLLRSGLMTWATGARVRVGL